MGLVRTLQLLLLYRHCNVRLVPLVLTRPALVRQGALHAQQERSRPPHRPLPVLHAPSVVPVCGPQLVHQFVSRVLLVIGHLLPGLRHA